MFLKVTRLVFLRLTRISTVCVVARLSVAGKWVRRAAKGRVLVAVKRRRRSVRILLAACGDGVIVVMGAAMAFAVAVQCCRQLVATVCGLARLDAAMTRVKVSVRSES